ncbi:MAG TPA: hypothetical protein VGF36_02850, partial [Rhodopila sp.]
MAQEQEFFRLENPWPKLGWGALAGVIIVSAAIGFGVLSRYQQNGPTLDLWNAICRGLGITADSGPATETAPPLRTPTQIALTRGTL